MPAPLLRGANVALTREIPSLRSVVLGVRLTSSEPVLTDNLVVATILCDARSKALSDEHFVFLNQLTSPDGSVSTRPAGSSRASDDTAQIEVDLGDVPPEVARIVVVAYVNEGMVSHRSLSQLKDASLRVLDLAGDVELLRSENLAPGLTTETGLVLGELYRHDGGWKVKVIGQGYAQGLTAMAADFGLGL